MLALHPSQTCEYPQGLNAMADSQHSDFAEKQIRFLSSVLSMMTRSPRVLVVDDDDNDIYLLSRSLSIFQVEVTVAKSSEEAIEKLLNESFDVAFIDYKMPCFDGYEIIKRVIWDSRGTNFFLVSGYPESQIVSGAVKAGALLMLSKPVSTQILARLFQLKPSELPPEV